MTQTALFTQILEQATGIQVEYGYANLCASHIAAAVAEFCATKYTGFPFSQYSYPRFEDERLRYLFAKEIKLRAFFRLRLSQHSKKGIAEPPFSLEQCEVLATLQDRKMLSADILFLSALSQLHPAYVGTVRTNPSQEGILAMLRDTDQNIYDYTIEQISGIIEALQKKSAEAAAIRDWKPAAKFAEPEDLPARLFGNIETQRTGNVLNLKLPKFFGTSNLKLSIHLAEGCYYIHDNGCSLRHLAKQINDAEKQARILKKVCHPRWIDGKKITGCFTSSFSFFYYLQRLVFVAHADLYYTKATALLYYNEKSYHYITPKQAEPLDDNALLAVLKEGIGFAYNENRGLYCWVEAKCSLSSGRLFFQIESLPDGIVRISDWKKGKYEGEIFEEFYWNNRDIAPYGSFILKLSNRFGGEFDGRDVYITDKQSVFFQQWRDFST